MSAYVNKNLLYEHPSVHTHTQTHTHTQRERERERERDTILSICLIYGNVFCFLRDVLQLSVISSERRKRKKLVLNTCRIVFNTYSTALHFMTQLITSGENLAKQHQHPQIIAHLIRAAFYLFKNEVYPLNTYIY